MSDSAVKSVANLILASSSPRRRELLSIITDQFEVYPANVSEDIDDALPPNAMVQRLAERKARAVAPHFPNAVILGADTLVFLNDEPLGKPTSDADARHMLQQLSGTTHHVTTGVALLATDAESQINASTIFAESTRVAFGALSAELIARYVATENPLDKAGSYGIQDALTGLFVKGIYGDYNTIVGLPVHRLYRELQRMAPALFNTT